VWTALVWWRGSRDTNGPGAGATDSEKIMYLFQNKTKITNSDVESLLGVSDATATRRLQDLETAGKIKQIGNIGQGVYYIKA